MDSGPFETCASPQTYLNVRNGAHLFEVRAEDEAGNADTSPAAFTWKVKRSR